MAARYSPILRFNSDTRISRQKNSTGECEVSRTASPSARHALARSRRSARRGPVAADAEPRRDREKGGNRIGRHTRPARRARHSALPLWTSLADAWTRERHVVASRTGCPAGRGRAGPGHGLPGHDGGGRDPGNTTGAPTPSGDTPAGGSRWPIYAAPKPVRSSFPASAELRPSRPGRG